MWTIAKTFKFSASHQLTGLSSDHQCARLHGHNYTVRLELSSNVLTNGFIVDFAALAEFKALIDACDHRHLNDLFIFNPTSENLARHFFLQARQLWPLQVSAVVVSETEATWARFSA